MKILKPILCHVKKLYFTNLLLINKSFGFTAILFVFLSQAYSQSSQPKSTFSNGGLSASSTSFTMRAILGQTAIGTTSGTNVALSSGFLPGEYDAIASATIQSTSFPVSYSDDDNLIASITVNDPSLVREVTLFVRKLSYPGENPSGITTSESSAVYTATITDTNFGDDIGVAYYFEVANLNGFTQYTDTTFAYATVDASATSLADLQFGSDISDYQIISSNVVLDENNILDVFDELGEYDNTQWRLFHYENGSTNEFNSFTTVDVGKGYWLIVRDQTSISLGSGQYADVSPDNPFEVVLSPGFNQIGNPFNYDISWDGVLSANGNPAGVGDLITYDNGTLAANDELEVFGGGFVENTTDSNLTIEFPLDRTSLAASRKARPSKSLRNSIGSDEWEVSLSVSNGIAKNLLGGFGMRPDALTGKDKYDISSFPTPFDLADVQFVTGGNKLTKSVLPTSGKATWNFSLSGNGAAKISWDNFYFGDGDLELVLVDLASNRMIDMREENEINIVSGSSRSFKIIYGDEQFISQEAMPSGVLLGSFYPNPVNETLKVPLALSTGANNYQVRARVYDLQGRLIEILIEDEFVAGLYEFEWTVAGKSIAGGTYQLVITISSGDKDWNFTKKIIVDKNP